MQQVRVYNPASDSAWSSQVYQSAKQVIEEVLAASATPLPFDDINRAVQTRFPSLCNDSIRDRQQLSVPYWRHRVASALQTLKKENKVRRAGSGWQWGGTTSVTPVTPPLSPRPVLSPPTPDNIRQRLSERLLQLDAGEFEKIAGKLLEAMGLTEVNITGRTADGGIDGEATVPILSLKVAFQAKKYAPENRVGIEPVQRLAGTVVTRGYDRGMLITTSDFSAGAKEEAERPGSRVILINGETFVDLMLQKGIGVRRVPVLSEEIDEALFTQLR